MAFVLWTGTSLRVRPRYRPMPKLNIDHDSRIERFLGGRRAAIPMKIAAGCGNTIDSARGVSACSASATAAVRFSLEECRVYVFCSWASLLAATRPSEAKVARSAEAANSLLQSGLSRRRKQITAADSGSAFSGGSTGRVCRGIIRPHEGPHEYPKPLGSLRGYAAQAPTAGANPMPLRAPLLRSPEVDFNRRALPYPLAA
jgi:hypothetical protein